MSYLSVLGGVAARSEGKQKLRENETNKKIPNVTNFLLFLHRIPKIWKADFFPGFHLGVWTQSLVSFT